MSRRRPGRASPAALHDAAVPDAGQGRRDLQARQQRRRFAGAQTRCALEPHGVRDDDEVLLVEQIPVDVEEVVGHLPEPALTRQADDGELLDHAAHLLGRDVELVRRLGERHLALADQVRHELQDQRGAVGRRQRLACAHDALPPIGVRREGAFQPRDHLGAQVCGFDHPHLRPVRGQLVGEDVDVHVGHLDPLPRRFGAPAQPQRRLGARRDLEQRALPRGDLGEARERPIAGVLAAGEIERGLGHGDVGGDAREEEGADVLSAEVEAVHVPARLVLHERVRLDTTARRGILPRLEVVELDDPALFDRPLQRGERRLAEVDARRVADDRRVHLDAERADLAEPAAGVGRHRALAPDASGQVQHREFRRREVDVGGQFVFRRRNAVARFAQIVGVGVVADRLHGDAEGAQVLLVALEHLLQRILGRARLTLLAIAGDRRQDRLLGEPLLGRHERDDEIHQALFRRGTGRLGGHPTILGVGCAAGQEDAGASMPRMSMTKTSVASPGIVPLPSAP